MSRWSRVIRGSIILFLIAILLTATGVFRTYADGPTHTVQPGENLFRIALQYGTTVEALASANNISDPTHIYVGQVLTIPGQPAPAQPPTNQQPNAVPVQQQEIGRASCRERV